MSKGKPIHPLIQFCRKFQFDNNSTKTHFPLGEIWEKFQPAKKLLSIFSIQDLPRIYLCQECRLHLLRKEEERGSQADDNLKKNVKTTTRSRSAIEKKFLQGESFSLHDPEVLKEIGGRASCTSSATVNPTNSGMDISSRLLAQIGAIPLVETSYCTLMAFIIPPGLQLPLHDHPSMTILHKVLHGELESFSLDWKKKSSSGSLVGQERGGKVTSRTTHDILRQEGEGSSRRYDRREEINGHNLQQHCLHMKQEDGCGVPSNNNNNNDGNAVIVHNTILTPQSPIHVIRPQGGGVLHQFACPLPPSSSQASPAIFLDAIAPPYLPLGRAKCTYYDCGSSFINSSITEVKQSPGVERRKEFPPALFHAGQSVFLKPMVPQPWFYMHSFRCDW